MSYRIFLPLLALIVANSSLIAQEHTCGTTEMVEQSLNENPEKRLQLQELEEFTQAYVQSQVYAEDSGDVKVIPIVFHIIHNWGAENISKAQVVDAVRIINEDFRKMNADSGDVITAFADIAVDSHIEFRLARLDPDGNCTEGITRTASELTFNAGENVKGLVGWDTKKYLNVWVVDNISSGAGAYAFYPGTAPSQSNEGIVNRNSQLGGIGTSGGSNFSRRTLTHEIGHYLNLPHVWGNSNNVNQASNCFGDDGVADTPNCLGTPQTCDLTRNTCGSLDNIQNYMDYSTCGKMYTIGQAQRMAAALNSGAGNRNNLWTEANLLATGTSNGFVATCTPIAEFEADALIGCQGSTIQFTDRSYNAEVDGTWTWQWTFPGGTPATSNQQNPLITYDAAGVFDVTLTVTNGSGSNTLTKTQTIGIVPTVDALVAPFYEGMESPTFPAHDQIPAQDWTFYSNFELVERTEKAGQTGFASVRFNNLNIPPNFTSSMISPAIDLTNATEQEAALTFELSYAKEDAAADDNLLVYITKNCGEKWIPRYGLTGDALVTNLGGLQNDEFIPLPEEWRTESIFIGDFIGEVIQLKFEVTSGRGNYLYIDNINLGGVNVGINDKDAKTQPFDALVYPNPATSNSNLRITTSQNLNLDVKLQDLLGRDVSSTVQLNPQKGNNVYPLSTLFEQPAPGIYLLQFSGPNGQSSKKIFIR